jgi:hypothetical protein
MRFAIRTVVILAALVVTSVSVVGCSAVPPRAAGETVLYATGSTPGAMTRVGVVDRTALLVAYYGSARHDRALRDLRARHAAAKAAGHEQLAQMLEAQGEAMQERAHRQLTGDADLGNVIRALGDHLAHVAAEQGLDQIVERGRMTPSSAARVDVTTEVAAYFTPARS